MDAGSEKKTPAESLCYTVEDLMQMLNASKNTVYKMIREGKFPVIQLGQRGKYRIPKNEFNDWLNHRNGQGPVFAYYR